MKHTLADDASASPFGSRCSRLSLVYGLSVSVTSPPQENTEAAASVLQQLNYTKQEKLTLARSFKACMSIILGRTSTRREYEFKNELLRDVLSGGWETATVQFEQPCGDVRADMVVYYPQGGAHAYEIKTGRGFAFRVCCVRLRFIAGVPEK